MLLRSFAIVTKCLCLSIVSSAQIGKISGRVTDLANNPVTRATISFEGSPWNKTMTDDNGYFITVRQLASDTVIICTHVNFITGEQNIRNNNIVNLQLLPKADGMILPMIEDSMMLADNSADEEQRFADSLFKVNDGRKFHRVEIQPQFAGGGRALMRYYKTGLQKKRLALKKNLEASVVVGFIIQKDGKPRDIRVIKGVSKELDAAILNLTETMPAWEPAQQNGKYSEYNYVLTIPVRLNPAHR